MRDSAREVELVSSEIPYAGQVWAIRKDSFVLGQQTLIRDFVQHMGAVGIVAVNSDGQILTVRQYRHPVAMEMIEIPAGLIDAPSEDPLMAAQRELREETGFTARNWNVLVDICTSPGSSSETIRIYLAQDLDEHEWGNAELQGEEREMVRNFVSLETSLKSIFAGEWQSPTAVSGVLAYFAYVNQDLELRASDVVWPTRNSNINSDRVFLKP